MNTAGIAETFMYFWRQHDWARGWRASLCRLHQGSSSCLLHIMLVSLWPGRSSSRGDVLWSVTQGELLSITAGKANPEKQTQLRGRAGEEPLQTTAESTGDSPSSSQLFVGAKAICVGIKVPLRWRKNDFQIVIESLSKLALPQGPWLCPNWSSTSFSFSAFGSWFYNTPICILLLSGTGYSLGEED